LFCRDCSQSPTKAISPDWQQVLLLREQSNEMLSQSEAIMLVHFANGASAVRLRGRDALKGEPIGREKHIELACREFCCIPHPNRFFRSITTYSRRIQDHHNV
jgi:hypothetical protein